MYPTTPASSAIRMGVDFWLEAMRGYLTEWLRGTVLMYAESAWRNVARMMNAVTGRSFSITVWAETGVTSTIQGDASSWRRNRVYAWMSTVRPFTSNCTGGGGPSSTVVVSALRPRAGLAAGAGFNAFWVGPKGPTSTSQV